MLGNREFDASWNLNFSSFWTKKIFFFLGPVCLSAGMAETEISAKILSIISTKSSFGPLVLLSFYQSIVKWIIEQHNRVKLNQKNGILETVRGV